MRPPLDVACDTSNRYCLVGIQAGIQARARRAPSSRSESRGEQYSTMESLLASFTPESMAPSLGSGPVVSQRDEEYYTSLARRHVAGRHGGCPGAVPPIGSKPHDGVMSA